MTSTLKVAFLLVCLAGLAAHAGDLGPPIQAGRPQTSKFDPSSVAAMRNYYERLEARGSEADWIQGYLNDVQMRAFPYDRIDPSMIPNAVAYRDSYKYGTQPPVAGRWAFIGPVNNPGVTGQYYSTGPVSGRVNCIAFRDGTAASPIYVGAGGGVFEGRYDGSTAWNGGKQWRSLSENDPNGSWDMLPASSIAVNPKNPNEMIVGTGDYHGFRKEGCVGIRRGTLNNGKWAFKNIARVTFNSKAVSRILYDPDNPAIVLAATGRGADIPSRYGTLWRSINGGSNWTAPPDVNINSRSWNDIAYSQKDAATGTRTYYAVGYNPNESGELWRSRDRGRTWTKLVAPWSNGDQSGIDVCTSATDPDTAYLLSGEDHSVWRTNDRGDTWDRIVGPALADRHGFPFDMTNPAEADYNWSQSNYDYYIACTSSIQGGVPTDDVFVGLLTIAESADGGDTWNDAGHTYDTNFAGDYGTHNDQHCVAFRPGRPGEILFGDDGGIYKWVPPYNVPIDASLNRDLGIAEFYQAAWDVFNRNPNKILGGLQDNAGTFTDGANPPVWQQGIPMGDASGSVIGKQNANGVNFEYSSGYVGTNGLNFARTDTDWVPFNNLFENIDFGTDFHAPYPPLSGDPLNNEVCYTASNALYKFDFGVVNHWSLTSNQILSTTAWVTCITVDPTDSNIVYTGSLDGEVWRSTDPTDPTKWTRIDPALRGDVLPYRPVSDIKINPGSHNQVFISFSGNSGAPNRIFRCDDVTQGYSTRAWTSISNGGLPPDLPINCIELSVTDPPRIIYLGTDIGVFYTKDGGTTWKNGTANLGLPNVRVNSLAVIQGAPLTLSAATFGRGNWRADLPLP
jgi:photosystem II stability/assembly factor-like uncharacterized protein